MRCSIWIMTLVVVLFQVSEALGGPGPESTRAIPTPLPSHPGNIFLHDEVVSVPIPAVVTPGGKWRILNDRAEAVKEGVVEPSGNSGDRIEIGQPGIGWYRIEFLNPQGEIASWTTAAVLARLPAPVPEDSPVCLDAALSWYKENEPGDRENLASLAALAGVNGIRDRIRWREVQPSPDVFITSTVYDQLAAYQAGLGMRVLQVFHGAPQWALGDGQGDLPQDLRTTYQFCKAMSQRFQGSVQAWEPWNEGNAGNFGGLTIDEMCSDQKAAYLGFKAGDENVTVGWQPFGGVNISALTEGLLANETWPYYDTYNLHSYDWPESYESLWAPARKAACGKPIWVTECDRGMKADPASVTGDLSMENDLRKAEFVVQSYACSLHSGSVRHYHFILGHYMEQEGTIQFGVLRRDLTPRPGYVALAAVGHLLAGAESLGRWVVDGKPDVFVMAFRGRPNGEDRDVLVAWTEVKGDWDQRGKASVEWSLPTGTVVQKVFDYLGRSRGAETPTLLTSSPVFIVLPHGEADKLKLTRPTLSTEREGQPSPVVLQLLMPQNARKTARDGWTDVNDRVFSTTSENEMRIVAYNFGGGRVEGKVLMESIPDGWRTGMGPWEMMLDPMEREEIKMFLTSSGDKAPGPEDEWIRIRGDFGDAGRPCLAFRIKRTGD